MKTYKKGTKILLRSSCNYVGCGTEEELILNDDTTEDELQEIATEFAQEDIAPEGNFEVIK